MTLVVGVRCQDGVVLASDSQATYATGPRGTRTIARQDSKKIHTIEKRSLIAVSGPVGFGQSFRKILSDCVSDLVDAGEGSIDWGPIKIKDEVGKRIQGKFLERELRVANFAQMPAQSNTLIAIPSGNGPTLINYGQTFSGEVATEGVPFSAIGSGQTNADPFLAFLSRVLWDGAFPDLPTGRLAAIWTLEHCIEVDTGGVGGDIQVAQIKREDGCWSAEDLGDAIIEEHKEKLKILKVK